MSRGEPRAALDQAGTTLFRDTMFTRPARQVSTTFGYRRARRDGGRVVVVRRSRPDGPSAACRPLPAAVAVVRPGLHPPRLATSPARVAGRRGGSRAPGR